MRTIESIVDIGPTPWIKVPIPDDIKPGRTEIILLIPDDESEARRSLEALESVHEAERNTDEARALLAAAEMHARDLLSHAEEAKAQAESILKQAENAVWNLLAEANRQRTTLEEKSRRQILSKSWEQGRIADEEQARTSAKELESLVSALSDLLGSV